MDLMQKIVSLCKRRGFVFQSSEIYGGLKSAYDYGPLGVELKRNLMNEWWKEMVHSRSNVYGLDSSIIMHPDVWRSSGHLSNFSDSLVDCLLCGERFRPDKVPRISRDAKVEIFLESKEKAKSVFGRLLKMFPNCTFERNGEEIFLISSEIVRERDYECPRCHSPFLSPERSFHGMFRTSMGPVDPLGEVLSVMKDGVLRGDSDEDLRRSLESVLSPSSVYLRPETAQGMFVQFLNVSQSMSAKIPFGIAQMGKSFRNEVTTEHFIFRSCEFDQMEMEYFVHPGEGRKYLEYWTDSRMKWWKSLGLSGDKLRLREHSPEECAFYSEGTFDIEYQFPWGWDELEGIASRTDFDLTSHEKGSGKNLTYLDSEATDPNTGKKGWRFVPHVVEPAAGATRGMLALLCNSYCEEGDRVFLRLNPKLAPIKCGVFPLVKKEERLVKVSKEIVSSFQKEGISSTFDENHSIGRRYARHDEIGTPFCITVDSQTLEDETVTVRFRDDRSQERFPFSNLVSLISSFLK